MTQNGNFKRRVRARAAKTGESYTAALHNIRQQPDRPALRSLRLAVAQTSLLTILAMFRHFAPWSGDASPHA